MKALFINPEQQSIEPVDIAGLEDIKSLVGFDTLESDAIGSEGDKLYFDEECFLRGASGRFQIDTVIPVSGRGVVVGTVRGGEALSDVTTGIDDLRNRTTFS
jgi:hypothetical protein